MELPRSVPTDALILEMGYWPIRFEIEVRQLTYLKRIINREQNDPVYQLYQEMLKYSSENNWANNILDLCRKHNLPLKDENISNMPKPVWTFKNRRYTDEIRMLYQDLLFLGEYDYICDQKGHGKVG